MTANQIADHISVQSDNNGNFAYDNLSARYLAMSLHFILVWTGNCVTLLAVDHQFKYIYLASFKESPYFCIWDIKKIWNIVQHIMINKIFFFLIKNSKYCRSDDLRNQEIWSPTGAVEDFFSVVVAVIQKNDFNSFLWYISATVVEVNITCLSLKLATELNFIVAFSFRIWEQTLR